MIEDAVLRDLFKAESDEHLQHLDDALLRLEKTPADQALLEEAFREAHSLKGAARMLGLNTLQMPAHRLEDELNAARRGVQALTPQSIERMTVELVELRRLTQEALAGAAAAPLTAPTPAPPEPAPAPLSTPEPVALPLAPFHIESVRVDTRKLDTDPQNLVYGKNV